MFSAAYQDEFYKALRNALHAEVDSWKNDIPSYHSTDLASFWQRVYDLEPITRIPEATTILFDRTREDHNDQTFVPLQNLTPAAGQI
jgi:anaerobic magnesium-protoporphyrin IX monomethyl ester cyclase